MARRDQAVEKTSYSRPLLLALFQGLVIFGTLVIVTVLLMVERPNVGPEIIFWVITVAVVELLPVPFWRGLQMSMGFPILLATGFLYPPAIAGLVALIGSCDPREFKREVSVPTALFNRAQVAISVLGGSLVFHQVATIRSSVPWVLAGAVAATQRPAGWTVDGRSGER